MPRPVKKAEAKPELKVEHKFSLPSEDQDLVAEKSPTATSVLFGDEGKTAEEVLKDYHLWEGWAKSYRIIPLGPNNELHLPDKKDEKDPEAVGFATPLGPVEFALRNERKYPPPTDTDMYREMFKLVQHTLKLKILKRSYTMSIIYNHICRNARDSPGWQRGFIKAKGPQMFFEIWREPEPAEGPQDRRRSMGDRYWVMAIFGRMCGTCEKSRHELVRLGVVDFIIAGTTDADTNVRDCAVLALKGLIQSPEGRSAVSYDKLIETLAKR